MRATAMYLANRRLALTRRAERERSVHQVVSAGDAHTDANQDASPDAVPAR